MYGDFNDIFENISKAAKDFQQELSRYAQERGAYGGQASYCKNNYDDYSWPPANIFTATCGAEGGADTLVFEFGLAGFDEKDITLVFQGDYMVLSAICRGALKNCGERESAAPEASYLKKALRMDAVEKQKYYAPADKYDQEKTKAVFKNGLLRVSIPPKEDDEQNSGIKIEISS
jgi:HSP20 family molecular chaperone IbpA